MSKRNNLAATIFVGFAISMMIAACGGGTSSTSSTTPPRINFPPSVSLSISSDSIEENGIVTLDASGTTDANGDALTFTWSQTAGPDIVVSNAGAASIMFRVPFVNEDVEAEFQLTVTDGERAVTELARFLITNRVSGEAYKNQSIKSQETIDLDSQPQLIWDTLFGLIGFLDDNGNIVFQGVSSANTVGATATTDPRSATFPRDALFNNQTLRAFRYDEEERNSLSAGGRVVDTLVVKPSDGEVMAITEGNTGQVSTSTLDVTSPCAADTLIRYSQLVDPTTGFQADPLGLNGVIVARSTGGFSIFEAIGSTNSNSRPGTQTSYDELTVTENPSGVFCDIVATNRYIDQRFELSRSGNFFTEYTSSGTSSLSGNLILAVDREAQTASLFLTEWIQGSDTINLSHIEKVDLDFETAVPLSFVDSVVLEAYDGRGVSDAGLGLLFTDGQDVGNHRLLIVGIGDDDKIVQTVRKWDKGVPLKIEEGRLYGKKPSGGCNNCPVERITFDLIIALKDSDSFIVFQQPGYRSMISNNDSLGLYFTEPARLNIGEASWFELDRPANIIGPRSAFIFANSDVPELKVLEFQYDETVP